MYTKRIVMFFALCVFLLVPGMYLFAENEQGEGNTNPSFALTHLVSVDASLSYKFTNNQGVTINSKTLEIGTANSVGMFYATFNTTRKINIELIWTPLIREGESEASADTVYPYVMTLTNHSGNTLPSYSSPEAGVSASALEFVVYGEYGSGAAYFINKWLTKTSTQLFEDSLICSMSIAIQENDSLPPGTYSGSIYFITAGN